MEDSNHDLPLPSRPHRISTQFPTLDAFGNPTFFLYQRTTPHTNFIVARPIRNSQQMTGLSPELPERNPSGTSTLNGSRTSLDEKQKIPMAEDEKDGSDFEKALEGSSAASPVTHPEDTAARPSTRPATRPSAGPPADPPAGPPMGPPGMAGHEYPPTKVVAPIMGALILTFFLMALDRTIIAQAIPKITDEFDSLGDIGWYGSSYMLTSKLHSDWYRPHFVFANAI
jgi:hypothetical protein